MKHMLKFNSRIIICAILIFVKDNNIKGQGIVQGIVIDD